MYEDARRYRADMKAKAHRMAGGDPHAKVDSSDWTPPEPANMDVQVGERPISPRQYKRGGQVEGEHAMQRADRAPRKAGGPLTANSLINRDVKEANEERTGTKHVGGFASGGNAGDMVPTGLLPSQPTSSRLSKIAGLKTGGKADASVTGTPITGGRTPRASGGRADHPHWIKEAIGHPGALHRTLHVPSGEKIPEKKLEKAEHSSNPRLRKEADLAKTLKGMHRAERASGGRTKGKVNVNVIIAQPGSGGGDAGMAAGMPPPEMAGPVKPPMPPPGPPMPPQGMPPGLIGPGGPQPGGPPPMPPPMARRRGGPAYEAGAGSGEGRLEKIAHYGKRA